MEHARSPADLDQSNGRQQGRRAHVRFAHRVSPGQIVYYIGQVGSEIGEKPKTKGALRALGLRGIGSSNLQPYSPDPAADTTLGSLRRAMHLVEFEILEYGTTYARKRAPEFHQRLAVDEWRHPAAAGSARIRSTLGTESSGSQPVKIAPTPYDISSGPNMGARFTLADDSLVLLEQHDLNTLTWPTELRLSEFFREATPIVALGKRAVDLYSDDGIQSVKLDDMKGMSKSEEEPIFVARVDDFERQVSLVWQRSLYEQNNVEGGVASRRLLGLDLFHLLQNTGTRAVREAYEDIEAVLKEGGY